MLSVRKILPVGLRSCTNTAASTRMIIARLLSTYSDNSGSDGSDDKGEDGEPHRPFPGPICYCPGDCNVLPENLFDNRKYSKGLPQNDVRPCFETLPNVPTGIFRCTNGETLGKGATKCSCYPNPEYFSYHNMSYYDVHLYFCGCRKPRPKSNRKP